MVRRGAKNLILLSRFGPRTEAAQGLLQELRGQSIRVEAPPCDVSNEDVLKSVLAGLMQTLPPIKGCIQSSMLLKVRTVLPVLASLVFPEAYGRHPSGGVTSVHPAEKKHTHNHFPGLHL